ncbi:MAG TPA: hypothetical protein PLQ45_02005 [Anaerohalosphaeraceae bacterium]|jgi:hypothetical protein|nr:hypothetical protein [Anaerohalosphaeraceae bacterium]
MQTAEAIHLLQRTLQGTRAVDEYTHYNLGILEDRLEQLKRKSPLFQGICFSEDIENLAGRSAAIAVH